VAFGAGEALDEMTGHTITTTLKDCLKQFIVIFEPSCAQTNFEINIGSQIKILVKKRTHFLGSRMNKYTLWVLRK